MSSQCCKLTNSDRLNAEDHLWTAEGSVLLCICWIPVDFNTRTAHSLLIETCLFYLELCFTSLVILRLNFAVSKHVLCSFFSRLEEESSAFYSSARLWDDGVILPQNTRKVGGFVFPQCMFSDTFLSSDLTMNVWASGSFTRGQLSCWFPEPDLRVLTLFLLVLSFKFSSVL